ncbi:MAG: hypothetical protein ACLRSD_09105 [Oscillibacter sp.]
MLEGDKVAPWQAPEQPREHGKRAEMGREPGAVNKKSGPSEPLSRLRKNKKALKRRVTSVFAVRKPWCTSNSFVCTLLNVLRIPKPAHLRRAIILRSKILAEVEFTSTKHFNYPWVKPPAARETKKRAEWRVTSVFALRKPWCTSNSFVWCAVKCPTDTKTAHLRRASILRSKILAEVGFTSTSIFNSPWVKPPAARETKKRAEWRVTSVFALRKPCVAASNSFVCALLNVPRIPKPAHLRRASILRSKILAEVGFTSTEHFNYPWVKPPAARETKNAPSGASQAFSLCENLGAQAIHLFVRC